MFKDHCKAQDVQRVADSILAALGAYFRRHLQIILAMFYQLFKLDVCRVFLVLHLQQTTKGTVMTFTVLFM